MPNSRYDPSDSDYYWAEDDDDEGDDEYNGDTGRAFVDGRWIVVDQDQNDRFWGRE